MPDHVMPDRPIAAPESSRGPASGNGSSANTAPLDATSTAESDLAGLAALFATRGGGNLPAQLSADLALEIVLNEIVEQACLATGASGAAVALLRDGEMVCSASSGAAPELGTRLDSDSGLTAECVATRQAQRCDDAQNDLRADIEASRGLGVRSVMVVPLLRNDELLGVLEVFSSRAGVFRERDEATLGALVQRILKNLELARTTTTSEPTPIEPEVLPIVSAEAQDAPANPEPILSESELANWPAPRPQITRSRFDTATFVLSAAVVLVAVVFGAFVGITVGRRNSSASHSTEKSGAITTRSASGAGSTAVTQRNGTNASAEPKPEASITSEAKEPEKLLSPSASEKIASSSQPSITRSVVSPVPTGGLLVYQNGKEIFRLSPGGSTATRSGETRPAETPAGEASAQQVMQPASDREQDGIVQVPPQTAEGSVAYRVEPEYPEEARQQNIQGPVVLDVRIARDGAVQEVKVLSGPPLLAEAALAAVKQWRFKPRTWQGHAVEMQTKITLNFRMPM